MKLTLRWCRWTDPKISIIGQFSFGLETFKMLYYTRANECSIAKFLTYQWHTQQTKYTMNASDIKNFSLIRTMQNELLLSHCCATFSCMECFQQLLFIETGHKGANQFSLFWCHSIVLVAVPRYHSRQITVALKQKVFESKYSQISHVFHAYKV